MLPTSSPPLRRPTVYAHRGASLERPENTVEAFRLALELGADAIETDAHLTRDGRVVLSHDPTGERACGVAKEIRACTLGEVRAWDAGAGFVAQDGSRPFAGAGLRVPTLDEALAELPSAFFNVDAKQTSPDMVPALLRAIRGADACARVRIASFSTATLRRVRALGYEGPTGMSQTEIARALVVPFVGGARGDAAQIPTRAYGVTLASRRAIARLHAAGARVDFWTIDDPHEARALVAIGADGVVTNDPRSIVAALRGDDRAT